jgi:hypothetical protein
MEAGSTHGIIYLDDYMYEVPIEQYAQLATLLGKVTFGDFTLDSDQLMSSKIFSSFVGGMLAQRLREGPDETNYAFASGFNTMYPRQLGFLEKTVQVSAMKHVLGDYNDVMYGASATNLLAWNETTDSTTSVGALTTEPVYRGIEFQGKLFIPQGVGFQSYNGSSIAAQNTTVKAICFEFWDDKLYALTSDKKLYVCLDGVNWSLEYSLQSSIVPRKLKLYMDNSGEPSLYMSSNRGLYAWDDLSKKFVPTRIGPTIPPHPDNGLAMAHWRPGEDLFYSAGMDLYRFTGNAIAPNSGLSQRYGLPPVYRGKIVDLCEGMNSMYALTMGVQESSPYVSAVESDPGMVSEPEFEASLTDAKNVLMQYNGYGWHPADTPTASGTPGWIVVSGAAGEHRVWWSAGGSAYTQRLSRTNLNLLQRAEVLEGEYQTAGVMEFGRFDAGMVMFDKVLSHIETRLEVFDPAIHDLYYTYKTDADTEWRNLAPPVYQQGLNIHPFGVTVMEDGMLFSQGEACRWVEIRLHGTTSDDTRNIVLDSSVLKFIKRPLESVAWTYEINLMTSHKHGRGAQEQKDEIEDFATFPRFVRLRHGSNSQVSHRVYMSRSDGVNQTGDDPRGTRTVTLAQVRLDNFEGTHAQFLAEDGTVVM